MAVDITSTFGEWGGHFVTTLSWALPTILILLLVGFVFYKWKENKSYKYPITIFSARDEGGYREIECKGGFLRRKGSAPYFRIKYSLFKHTDMITPPKLEGVTLYNRIYYLQKDIDTFVQMRRKMDESIVNFIPVESDMKYGAILQIKRIREIMTTKSNFEKYAPTATVFFGLVIILIMFYMLMKQMDPAMMQRVADTLKQTADTLARTKGV